MTKIALITGASSGIGENLTRLLIEQSWTVIAIARNEKKLLSLKQELGDRCITMICDVGQVEEIRKVSHSLKSQNLIPDLFFLNAGCGEIEPSGIDLELQRTTFAVNYFGAITWIEEWLPICEAKETTFVGISSIVALFATPKGAAYCASKAALKSAFDSLRIQYADSKVSFITVMPGPVDTAMLKTDRPVPFKVPPHDAAQLILKKVQAKKAIIIFPLFYKIFFRLLSVLPAKLVKKIL